MSRLLLCVPGRGALVAGLVAMLVLGSAPAVAVDVSPFEKLLGRWVGEGRLGIRDGATENVKCRVTYIPGGQADRLKQTIRCASAGGSVEVQSAVTHAAGTLTGTWKEMVHDMSGELSGAVTPKGFRVAIKGETLSANMDIILHNGKQIIEIQFNGSALVGMTLILEKG